jgi:hypothetical protein
VGDAVTTPTAPVLATIRQVEIAKVGDWPASTGIWHCTADDIANAVAALDCPAVRRPILKLGHTDPRFDGEPAVGYVANLAAADEGSTLIGDWTGMPAWLAAPNDDGETVAASAYPDRSVEGCYDYQCTLGHTHPFVIFAVALLGVERPAVGTLSSLQDVAALYGIAASTPTGGRPVRAHTGGPMPVAASISTEDVRRAYYDGPGESQWSWWVQAIYLDPPQLIVCDDGDGDLFRVPYTVDGQSVTFDPPIPVRVEYVDAPGDDGNTQQVAARSASAVFASRGDSRPIAATTYLPCGSCGSKKTDGAKCAACGTKLAPVKATAAPAVKPEGAGMDPVKLREDLGLTADASQIEVAAALATAGLIPKAADAPPVPEPVKPAIPDGAVVLEQDKYDELIAASTAGREARDQQLAERRETLVSAAVRDGRIAPARREHWVEQLTADPGADAVLAALKPGLVPVEAKGYVGPQDDNDDDAVLAAMFGPTDQKASA